MGSVYFLDAVADQRSGHTWLCFPADTSPPEIHSILRHASNKTKPLGLQLRSAAYGTLKPEERHFRTLTVRTASASETPFEFDIEGQREYELHFDPSSDTLCLNFKLSHDHQFVSDPNFSDTASSIISSKTSKSKSRIEELDQHQVYCRYRWHLRSFQSNLGLQVGIHTTDTDRSGARTKLTVVADTACVTEHFKKPVASHVAGSVTSAGPFAPSQFPFHVSIQHESLIISGPLLCNQFRKSLLALL